MPLDQKTGFYFRITLIPDEPPQIELWAHEHETGSPGTQSISDWIYTHLNQLYDTDDLCREFRVKVPSPVQAIGRGIITPESKDEDLVSFRFMGVKIAKMPAPEQATSELIGRSRE